MIIGLLSRRRAKPAVANVEKEVLPLFRPIYDRFAQTAFTHDRFQGAEGLLEVLKFAESDRGFMDVVSLAGDYPNVIFNLPGSNDIHLGVNQGGFYLWWGCEFGNIDYFGPEPRPIEDIKKYFPRTNAGTIRDGILQFLRDMPYASPRG